MRGKSMKRKQSKRGKSAMRRLAARASIRVKTKAAKGSSTRQAKRSAATFTLGRSSFESISAVEGIRLSAEMKRDFARFDRENLSSKKRRRALAEKYGRPSS